MKMSPAFKYISFGSCALFFISVCFLFLTQRLYAQTTGTESKTITIKGSDGSLRTLLAADDADEDGISNQLEVGGFVYDVVQDSLLPWDGDSSKAWYVTDPLRWSTDGDPYSDYTEATGVNMHSAVPYPESHPLVAARPVIRMEMVSYDVVPIGTITDTEGHEQSSAYTNTTSSQHEVGGSVTVGATAKLNPFEPAEASVEVSASYSYTWSTTKSSTSSLGSNWSRARSTNPDKAASLKMQVYMENIGSAPALNVQPEFNLKIGDKLIATVKPAFTQNQLSTGDRSEDILIDKDADGQDITVTLDELKALQSGMPLSLIVNQVSAEVPRWNSDTKSFESGVSWSSFEGDIDPVVVDLDANFGDGNQYYYQIYCGTKNFDPGFTFRDILSIVFDVQKNNGSYYINGRKYPDNWYVVACHDIVQDWNDAGRPQSMMDLPIISKNTRNSTIQAVIKMSSPGSKTGPRLNLATYSSDFRHILVSAFPNAFPILSAKANVVVDGQQREIELQDNGAYYTNTAPLDYPAEPNGTVTVEDVRGDITAAKAIIPAYYTSAEDVLKYSPLLEVPGGDEYLLFLAGDTTKAAVIYCDFSVVEIDTVTAEYLTLKQSPASNFTDGSNDGSFTGKVYFQKIRVQTNPDNPGLTVQPYDMRFTEAAAQGGYEAYGLSSLCTPPPEAGANIDLSGTPFQLDPYTQFYTESAVTIDADRKIVNIAYQPDLSGCHDVGVSGMFKLVYDDYQKYDVQQGLIGNALVFNPDSSAQLGHVYMSDSTSLQVSDAITLEAWIRPEAGGIILNKEGEYELFCWPDSTIRWALANGNPGWKTTNTYYKYQPGKWLHIALVYDRLAVNPAVKLYINGNLFYGLTASGVIGDYPNHAAQDSFRVGGRQATPADFFSGAIQEVRVWDVARSGEQIRAAFTDTLGPDIYDDPGSGLIGYWRFDQLEDLGVGSPGVNDARDLSVNHNHGDVVGNVILSDGINAVIASNLIRQPQKFALSQNYPNPFNPQTTIRYELPVASDVELTVYNMLGQKVVTLVTRRQAAGSYSVTFDAGSLASDVYFYRLRAGNFQAIRRMILIK